VERRAGPDLEIRLEEDRAFVDGDLALAPVDRVGRVGVDERSGRDQLRLVGLGQLLGRRRRGKHERIDEKTCRDAEGRAEHATEQEDRQHSPEAAHETISAGSLAATILQRGRDLRALQLRGSASRFSDAALCGASSIRGGQTPHGEFDASIGQFAPAFDLGHVGRLGKAAEYLARLRARLLAR
jgi:hypothetical protein